MQDGVKALGDSIFINTTYSFNSAVSSTYKYALDLISKDGGKVSDKKIMIKTQIPVAPDLEVSFPNVVFDKKISVFDEKDGHSKVNGNPLKLPAGITRSVKQSMYC